MPLVSSFFGILIYMYWDEHNPPHFHVKYGDEETVISLMPISIIKCIFPLKTDQFYHEN